MGHFDVIKFFSTLDAFTVVVLISMLLCSFVCIYTIIKEREHFLEECRECCSGSGDPEY